MRTLIEKSQAANAFSSTQQPMVTSAGRTRHLQTQGCPRSTLKTKPSMPQHEQQNQVPFSKTITTGANSIGSQKSREAATLKPDLLLSETNGKSQNGRRLGMHEPRHNSVNCTPPSIHTMQVTTGSKFMKK